MTVSRTVRAAATGFYGSMAWQASRVRVGIGHERHRCRASLSLHYDLWELAGWLERTDAAGTFETQGLKPGDGW